MKKLTHAKKIMLVIFYVSILVLLLKFIAFFFTQSNAVLIDALESIINIITGGFSLYSIYLIGIPKNKNHPYGYGKIEFFVFFLEGILILLMGIGLVGKSIFNFFYPNQISNLELGSILIGLTAVVNFIMGYFLSKKFKQLKIITLQAEGIHLIVDALVSSGVVLGLLVIHFTQITILDSIISVFVGVVVLFQGYSILRKSISGLMDETNFNIARDISLTLQKNKRENWIDIHNLRIISHGSKFHIDCHVTLPFYLSIEQAHDEVKKIEQLMNNNFVYATDVFIHTDPCLPECCKFCILVECKKRKEKFEQEFAWTVERLLENKKYSSV